MSAVAQDTAMNWSRMTISPVINPVFFEDPQIRSEVPPIFMHQTIHKDFATGGGDLQLYAAQIGWAVTDRLAFIATKDGYVDADIGALGSASGFADLAAGFKYAVIDDRERQLIVTPGVELELPTGNTEVFQGSGNAGGKTQATLGLGFRSRLRENLDIGFGYEKAIGSPKTIINDRFTIDLIFRF